MCFAKIALQFLKSNIMKKFFSLTMACIAMFLCSCSKNDLNNPVVNSTDAANTLSAAEAAPLKLLRSNTVNYGALIGFPTAQGSLSFQLNVADQVGVSCLRARTLVPATGPTSILNSKYKILLNFNSDYEGTPLPFVTDMTKYKTDLNNILATYTILPVVAVIENEESNKYYYSGTAEEYIRQLNTAIPIMHARGIKVANGGITNIGLNYLVYQDLLAQGKTDSAARFKLLTRLTPKSAGTQERGAFVNTLLTNYARMNLDYINFHWKGTSPDTESLNQVINYLRKVTRKPIINNELGQFDTDPNTLLSHIQLCTNQNLPYIVWYSPDESDEKKGMPLQHSDQSLTSSGFGYQGYLKN